MAAIFHLAALRAQLLFMLLATPACLATGMAAWMTTIGPQLLAQNLTTGKIEYSFCNSNNTPIFPLDPPNELKLPNPPRNGTSIAGTGWLDGNSGTTIASIFYQDEDGGLQNAYLTCNWDTGRFITTYNTPVSDDVPDDVGINEKTGLAALVLGATAGYRIYFHDNDMGVHQINYSVSDNIWGYAGRVTQDPAQSPALAAAFKDGENVTVISTHGAENMEQASFNSTRDRWQISTFPRPLTSSKLTDNSSASKFTLDTKVALNFTLPAWDGSPGGLGMSIARDNTLNVFYVGTDKKLYQVETHDSAWGVKTNQSSDKWPVADDVSAPLAVASDSYTNVVNVFYRSNRTLVQAQYGRDGTWHEAAALAVKNTTVIPTTPSATPTPSPSSSATASPSAGGASDDDLSSGAKAGIGVGVAFGVLGLLGLLLGLCLVRRRKAAKARVEKEATERQLHEAQALVAAQYQQQQQQWNNSNHNGYSPNYGYPPVPGHGSPPGYGQPQSVYSGKDLGTGGSPPMEKAHAELEHTHVNELATPNNARHELAGPIFSSELPSQQPGAEPGADADAGAGVGPDGRRSGVESPVVGDYHAR